MTGRPYDYEVDAPDLFVAAQHVAAAYPTRFERLLERLAHWRSPRGADNRFDRWRCRLQDRRARKGRHLAGKGRWPL